MKRGLHVCAWACAWESAAAVCMHWHVKRKLIAKVMEQACSHMVAIARLVSSSHRLFASSFRCFNCAAYPPAYQSELYANHGSDTEVLSRKQMLIDKPLLLVCPMMPLYKWSQLGLMQSAIV